MKHYKDRVIDINDVVAVDVGIGIARASNELFIGVLVGTLGAFMLIVGIRQNHVPMLTDG